MQPTNRKQLIDNLKQIIDETTGPIAIQAGHFAAIHDAVTHALIPGVYQEITDSEQREATHLNPYMGEFPALTWELGCELVAYARASGKRAGLVVLCNDWQWVESVESGDANPYRAKFYAHAQLPALYVSVLKKYGLDIDAVLPFNNQHGAMVHPLIFGETKLRKRYDKHFTGVCELGNACAQEYIPLLIQLQQDGIQTFISCVPKTCLMPVKVGSRAAKQNFNVTMDIVNLFPGAIGLQSFWDNLIVDKV